MVGKL